MSLDPGQLIERLHELAALWRARADESDRLMATEGDPVRACADELDAVVEEATRR